MNFKRKKKGSTFLIVVVLMSIIFTVGSTILAVTANDYKLRINESKRLQNLYLADSGLDIVENIIIKTSQKAIEYADKEVKKQLLNSTSDALSNSYDANNEFKAKFYEFLTIKKNNLDIMQYLILNKEVITSVNNTGSSIGVESGKIVQDEDKDYIIEIPENGYLVNKNNNEIENITIDVKSTFETKDEDLKHKRTVSTRFTIVAPQYTAEISDVNIYPVFDGKVITADGNMEVNGYKNGESSLNITGDIWIKGNSDSEKFNTPEFTFEKYKGGIDLENSNFTMNGNIYTNESLSLRNNVGSTITGSLYARNLYIGKEANSATSSDNKITITKDVIVNNDLALNAQNSVIEIQNNFYGINDKTVDSSTAEKALNSSSIIVNESKDSSLTVNNDSYILGVAYLNATDSNGNKYQTGESVAVKGNYLAYTDVQGVLDGVKDVTLKYYSPLQLLESSAETKAEYIYNYYNSENNNNEKRNYKFNNGGVTLNNVKSVGTGVDSEGKITSNNIDLDETPEEISDKRNEFARNVFAMGDSTEFNNLYESQTVERTVANQIDYSKIKTMESNYINKSNVILKGEDNEAIIIKDNEYNGEKIYEGLIITNGDITIQGNFEFKGSIITTGNIIFEGQGNRTITYDANVIKDILAEYKELQEIFKVGKSTTSQIKINSNSNIYNKDKFLTTTAWKIEK